MRRLQVLINDTTTVIITTTTIIVAAVITVTTIYLYPVSSIRFRKHEISSIREAVGAAAK